MNCSLYFVPVMCACISCMYCNRYFIAFVLLHLLGLEKCMPEVQPKVVIASDQEVLEEEEDESDSDQDPWLGTGNTDQDEEACAFPGLVDIEKICSESSAVELSPEWAVADHNGQASPESRTVAESNVPDTCSGFSVEPPFIRGEQQHTVETVSPLAAKLRLLQSVTGQGSSTCPVGFANASNTPDALPLLLSEDSDYADKELCERAQNRDKSPQVVLPCLEPADAESVCGLKHCSSQPHRNDNTMYSLVPLSSESGYSSKRSIPPLGQSVPSAAISSKQNAGVPQNATCMHISLPHTSSETGYSSKQSNELQENATDTGLVPTFSESEPSSEHNIECRETTIDRSLPPTSSVIVSASHCPKHFEQFDTDLFKAVPNATIERLQVISFIYHCCKIIRSS